MVYAASSATSGVAYFPTQEQGGDFKPIDLGNSSNFNSYIQTRQADPTRQMPINELQHLQSVFNDNPVMREALTNIGNFDSSRKYINKVPADQYRDMAVDRLAQYCTDQKYGYVGNTDANQRDNGIKALQTMLTSDEFVLKAVQNNDATWANNAIDALPEQVEDIEGGPESFSYKYQDAANNAMHSANEADDSPYRSEGFGSKLENFGKSMWHVVTGG